MRLRGRGNRKAMAESFSAQHEFDDVPKMRKAAKLLVLSQNDAATDAERKVAYHAAIALIERHSLDRIEVDAAACRLAGVPRGSFLKPPKVAKKKRWPWSKAE